MEAETFTKISSEDQSRVGKSLHVNPESVQQITLLFQNKHHSVRNYCCNYCPGNVSFVFMVAVKKHFCKYL